MCCGRRARFHHGIVPVFRLAATDCNIALRVAASLASDGLGPAAVSGGGDTVSKRRPPGGPIPRAYFNSKADERMPSGAPHRVQRLLSRPQTLVSSLPQQWKWTCSSSLQWQSAVTLISIPQDSHRNDSPCLGGEISTSALACDFLLATGSTRMAGPFPETEVA